MSREQKGSSHRPKTIQSQNDESLLDIAGKPATPTENRSVDGADARDRREAARKLLASGKDPSVERRLKKIAKASGGNTFREVGEEFLAKHRREGRSEAT